MASHRLKIKDHYYEQKVDGNKLFEIRSNLDKDFQKGDIVRYLDLDGNQRDDKVFMITYVTSFEQKPDFVVFGEKLIQE